MYNIWLDILDTTIYEVFYSALLLHRCRLLFIGHVKIQHHLSFKVKSQNDSPTSMSSYSSWSMQQKSNIHPNIKQKMMAVYWKCRHSWKFPPYLARLETQLVSQTQHNWRLKLSGPGGAASVKFVTFCSIQNLDFVTFYPVWNCEFNGIVSQIGWRVKCGVWVVTTNT